MTEHLPYTRSCFVCGVENEHGLQLRFRAEDSVVHADYTPRPHHAGYPGLLHGGAVGAVLDEAMFWAATHATGRMHVSAELSVRYRNKTLVDRAYRVQARLVQERGPVCRTEAELLDGDGQVCASATGKYLPLPAGDAAAVVADFFPDPETVPLQRYG